MLPDSERAIVRRENLHTVAPNRLTEPRMIVTAMVTPGRFGNHDLGREPQLLAPQTDAWRLSGNGCYALRPLAYFGCG